MDMLVSGRSRLRRLSQARLSAVPVGARSGGGPTVAEWAFPDSALDIDFVSGGIRANNGVIAPLGLTTTRATPVTAYADDVYGLWLPFAANSPRITSKGLLVEEARTNDALWSRDMTNAAWVLGATMTRALNQTGIDGTANSACLLTGGAVTATNTILQTITLGSTADTYSVWLKRVSGSGTISIAIDGVTWNAVAVTTTWTQFSVTSTLANPSFGIQITTNADSVAADFNQLEPGSAPSSPILTTTVAVTRAADVITVNNPPVLGATMTLFAKGTPNTPTGYATDQHISAYTDGSATNQVRITRVASTGAYRGRGDGGSAFTLTPTGTWNQSTSAKLAVAATGGDQAAVASGGTVVTTSAGNMPSATTIVNVGSRGDSTQQWNGYIERLAFFASRLSNGRLQAMTG